MNRTTKNIISSVALVALLGANVGSIVYLKNNSDLFDKTAATTSQNMGPGGMQGGGFQGGMEMPGDMDSSSDSDSDSSNFQRGPRGMRQTSGSTSTSDTTTNVTTETANAPTGTPPDMQNGQTGTPPEMPDGEAPEMSDGEMPTPPTDSDGTAPTDSNGTAPTKPDDTTAPQDVATETTNAETSKSVEAGDILENLAVISLGLEATLFGLILVYLFLSNFNQKSLAETFGTSTKTTIYILSSLIVVICAVLVDALVLAL